MSTTYDVEMAEGVAFLLQLALDRTVGCSMLLCFWWNGCGRFAVGSHAGCD